MPYYFAYGNNMRDATMAERCGPAGPETWQEVGVARLRDHRLAFTVSTPNWGGPVGDVLPEKGFFVYGYLYEVSDQCLADLDGAEFAVGETIYYARRTMQVEVVDPGKLNVAQSRVEAQVYFVPERPAEQPPEPRYLLRLIASADARGLPEPYRRALRSLLGWTNEEPQRKLLVLPTKDRGGRHALPIVQVAAGLKRRLRLGRLCFVVLDDRACMAKVVEWDALGEPSLVCRVDETIRRGLQIPVLEPGLQHFGARVELRPAPRRTFRKWLPARHLLLQVQRVEYLDAERDIAVVPEAILRTLGLDHGDYMSIEVARPAAHGGVEVRRLRRRAFTGSTRQLQFGDEPPRDYPEDGRLHLDYDARQALRLPDPLDALYPAMVSASTRHLVFKGLLFYGLALLGVSIGLTETVMPPLLETMLGRPVSVPMSFLGALALSLVLGAAAVGFDLSQKLRP